MAAGVTSAAPFVEARSEILRRIDKGMAGPLHFTYDDPDLSTDVTRSLPWARSLIVFAHTYVPGAGAPSGRGAVVARFAADNSYGPVQRTAQALIEALAAEGLRGEALIDDNRLVDRAAAARAGLGWLGKSTMVLAPGHGPWMLLGTVATDAELEPTPPMRRSCGTCVACIPACPTGAITDHGLDAGRCISTWLQAPGFIPRWIRPAIGRRIYGCDDCLTSCPPGNLALGRESTEREVLEFTDLLGMDDDSLLDRFRWFYIPRRDGRYLRRNILVAAGNSKEPTAVTAIADQMDHRSSIVRSHAYWAYARSLGSGAREELDRRRSVETVPEAIDELEFALTMVEHG